MNCTTKRVRAHFCVWWLVMVASACGSEERLEFSPCPHGEGSAGSTTSDSAGVVIVETACHVVDQPLGWLIDPDPIFELGGGEAQQFHEIGGVTALPGGGIAVLVGGSRELRYFDSNGELTAGVGGPGRGPGDFERPMLVPAFTSDSVVIFDRTLRKFARYSVEGSGVRERVLLDMPRAQTPLGMVGDAVLFEFTIIDGRILQPGPYEQDFAFLWVNSETGEGTTLVAFRVPTRFVVIDAATGMNFWVRTPFAAHAAAAATRHGAVISMGTRYEILTFDVSGRLRQIFRIDRARQPVTRSDFEAYRAHRIEAGMGSENSWARFDRMPLPDSMPAFASLKVDASGWIWAQLFDWDPRNPAAWLVFDPDGRARGTVTLPPGIVVHEIGDDYILGTWRDEWDVQHVRRHRLDRGREFASHPAGDES